MTQTWMEQFSQKLDMQYALDMIHRLTEIRSNPVLGYRPAGSRAELAAGDMLAEEMQRLGLEVSRDRIELDTWEFEKAVLEYTTPDGVCHTFQLGAYQTQFVTDGFQEFEEMCIRDRFYCLRLSHSSNFYTRKYQFRYEC